MAYIMENSIFLGAGLDMITITPPGADDLPWDTARCTHPPGVKCSGPLGCRVHPVALGAWHKSFAPRFDRLWRAAAEQLRRRGFPHMPCYLLCLEPQERGPLHIHVATSTRDRQAAAALATSLRRLAPQYGFGGRVGWDPCRGDDHQNARGMPAYLAKLARYMMKEADGEATGMHEVLKALPGRRVARASVRLTKESRVTMRNLRLRRWAHNVQPGCRNLRAVEALYLAKRAERDRAQAEATAVVALDLAFLRRPAPWRDAARLDVDWWTTLAPLNDRAAGPSAN
jgi:hypothetical protein